jgi:hypothetical protein
MRIRKQNRKKKTITLMGKLIAQAEGKTELSADILIIMPIMEQNFVDKILDPEYNLLFGTPLSSFA